MAAASTAAIFKARNYMGVFDGVLLCTDLDGTFALGKEINKADKEAVKYFMNNGGLFTLSTGRIIHYLADIFETVKPNTFVISLNGAVISDTTGNLIIKESFLPPLYEAALNTALLYKAVINDIYVYYKGCLEGTKLSPVDYVEKKQQIDKLKPIYKIVVTFNDEIAAEKAENEINSLNLGEICATRSWPTGMEILNTDSTKGAAVRFLKKHLGAKLLVCAGDYENDISMIKEADIGYAVGNAHPSLINVADRVTVPREKNAIAHIIDDIEKYMKNL